MNLRMPKAVAPSENTESAQLSVSQLVQCRHFPELAKNRRHPVDLFPTQMCPTMQRFTRTYNRVMADRIVCSCVLCPKCGAWVVLSAYNESGSKQCKIRTSCTVADCGRDFEFDFDEMHLRTAAQALRKAALLSL